MSTLIKRARQDAARGVGPPVLVLNGGDTFQGSVYYNLFKWRMAANFTNLLNFDAMVRGTTILHARGPFNYQLLQLRVGLVRENKTKDEQLGN